MSFASYRLASGKTLFVHTFSAAASSFFSASAECATCLRSTRSTHPLPFPHIFLLLSAALPCLLPPPLAPQAPSSPLLRALYATACVPRALWGSALRCESPISPNAAFASSAVLLSVPESLLNPCRRSCPACFPLRHRCYSRV